jgi:mono/diheme cytochrome c family protein
MATIGRVLRLPPLASGILLMACLSGCVQKMAEQPSYRPLQATTFFDDGRSARPQVPGTIARGQLELDDHYYRGRVDGQLATTIPLPITPELLMRGQQRFNIYCSPCHDRAGTGNGMIVQRGYHQPPSYHIPRLREAPVGHLFDVATNGYRLMPDYSAQVSVADRWAIVAYIRALQFSQYAPLDTIPREQREQLEALP